MGRRKKAPPGFRAPAGEARRLAAALSIAAGQGRHGALLMLARQAAADPALAESVIGILALAVPESARLAAEGVTGGHH